MSACPAAHARASRPGARSRRGAAAGALALAAGLLLAAFAEAQPAAIVLDGGASRVSLEPAADRWGDPDRTLSAAAAAARARTDSASPPGAVRWLRAPVMRTAGAPEVWILEAGVATADEVRAYFVAETAAGSWAAPRPLTRQSFGPRPTFQLTLPQDGRGVVLVRVTDFASTQDPLVVWTPAEAIRQSRAEWLWIGLFYGVLAVMVAFNLVVFAVIRERPHLHFVLFTLMLGLSGFVWDGLGRELLWPGGPALNRASLVVADALAAVTGVLFTRVYLDTAARTPRLHRALAAVAVVSAVAAALSMDPTWRVAYVLMDVASIVGPLVLLSAAWVCARQGFGPARYFLLATAVLLVGISVESAAPHVLAQAPGWIGHGGTVGTLVMVMLFSLGLVNRYNEVVRAEERLRAENQVLQTYSYRDPLTGIANRRAFDEHLASEWRRAAREGHELSLVVLDVDYFKRYNDHYGHKAGDACLREVARAVNGVLKRPGDLVARIGGEEFGGVLVAASAAGALEVAQSLCAAVAGLGLPHADSPASAAVTVSVGVATAQPGPGTTPEALFECADGALYEAKHAGRNRVAAAARALS